MLKSHPERLRKMPVHGVVFLPESIPHAASRLLIGFNAVVSCSRSKKKLKLLSQVSPGEENDQEVSTCIHLPY